MNRKACLGATAIANIHTYRAIPIRGSSSQGGNEREHFGPVHVSFLRRGLRACATGYGCRVFHDSFRGPFAPIWTGWNALETQGHPKEAV